MKYACMVRDENSKYLVVGFVDKKPHKFVQPALHLAGDTYEELKEKIDRLYSRALQGIKSVVEVVEL